MEIEYISVVEIILYSIARFWPVWLALAVTLGAGYIYREKIGLAGKLYASGVGMAGAGIVLFWVFTALFADLIAVMGPLDQSFTFGMKNFENSLTHNARAG